MTFTDLILSAHPYLDEFDYDHYPEHFHAFEKQFSLIFDLFSTENGAAIKEKANSLIEQLEARREELPRRERKDAVFRDKQVLALFLFPAAERLSPLAKEFADELREQWNRKYPRNTFLGGSFDQIMKGFDANLLGLPLRKSRKR